MHKLTFYFKDGQEKTEQAIWENANAAKLHAEQQMKVVKSIHMIAIKPMDGGNPINIVREEKKA